jgi:hypothetical protein
MLQLHTAKCGAYARRTRPAVLPYDMPKVLCRPQGVEDQSTHSKHPVALRVPVLEPIEEHNVPVQVTIMPFLHRRPQRIANK